MPKFSRERVTPERVKNAERVHEALELRKAGVTFEEIAKQLGYYDRSTARKAVKNAVDHLEMEPAAELRRLECERLDRLFQSMYAKALDASRRDCARCAEVALAVMQRRAQLLGLDAPQRIEEHVVTEDAVSAEIRRLEAEIAQRSAANVAAVEPPVIEGRCVED